MNIVPFQDVQEEFLTEDLENQHHIVVDRKKLLSFKDDEDVKKR